MVHKEFCLKWNDYLDVFHGAFLSLLNSEKFTDVTLSCDGQIIKCHRLVLSCCSSYFETLLLGISHPHPVIILKDVKFDDLLSLVNFMYAGEVTVPQAQASSLLKVAEMLKVKGLAYFDEVVNQTQRRSNLSQNTQLAAKRNRVDTTSENNSLAEDSSSNLEPPVADTSNDKLKDSPAETRSFAYKTDITACNSMQVKDEFAVGIDAGRNNSSCQFEDDGEHFDYGSEKLIGNRILERRERMQNTSLNFSDFEDALPSHNEEVVNVPNLPLFPKREAVPLGSFPGFSGSCKLQPYMQESGATSFDCQGVADTSPNNTNTLMEASDSNIGLLRKACTKDYQCNICDKRFSFHSSLERHRGIHTGKKPFKCNVCRKSFSQMCNLNTHQRVHTGEKPYKCDVCEKSFSQSQNLNKHKLVHTGEKRFKCDVCKKCFTRSGSLNLHQRVHTGVKPFRCDLCKRSFTQLMHLNRHRILHTGKKSF
ncbi:zinc finger protein 28 homolog isoform X4 [Artemia franciscana]|uniref:zinc finger protein 28 homolog isoform X4 n=1 Tax=Artemia franciscana TaxID=6661 RepID=UPI0032DA4359